MQEFNKQEIDEWKRIFEQRGYERRVTTIEGKSIDFFVLPVELFQGIPNGLFRMTGKRMDGYLIGVSSEVPDIIKPPFAMSEHDEFLVYGLEDPDRTLHSEQHMTKVITGTDLLGEYVRRKIALYSHMLTHYQPSWRFTDEDVAGFNRARQFLDHLLQ